MTLTPSGSATAPRLQDTVRMILERRPQVLVLDLLAVTFLGVSGLAALIDARQRAGKRTRLRVLAAGPAERLLRLTGVDRHLEPEAEIPIIGGARSVVPWARRPSPKR